jgi:hypothetical protein
MALTLGILVRVRSASHTATIQEVLADPGKYEGKVVRLSGEASAVSPVSVRGFHVFRLTDDTGSIWVLTRQSAPQSGTQIRLQGRVGSGLEADLPVIGKVGVGPAAYFIEEKRL